MIIIQKIYEIIQFHLKNELESSNSFFFLIEIIIVARVQPRTSKGITDLLLPQPSIISIIIVLESNSDISKNISNLISKKRSRSLSELTRQITPPTKNDHAPPPRKSRKSFQSVHPSSVLPW